MHFTNKVRNVFCLVFDVWFTSKKLKMPLIGAIWLLYGTKQ